MALAARSTWARRRGPPTRTTRGRRPKWLRSRSSSPCADLWTACSRLLGAAAGGPAPQGGTASSASAKVPSGHLAPRRPRTPTKRHQTPRDLPGILDGPLRTHLAMQPGSGLKCPGRPRSKPGRRSLTAASADAPQRGGSPIPAINGRRVISRADMAARGTPRTTVDPGTATGAGPVIRRRPAGSAGRTTGTKTSGPPGTRGTFGARSSR